MTSFPSRLVACTLFVLSMTAGMIVADDHVAKDHTKDSLATVKKNVAAKKAVLVDVREQAEWDKGHVADALLLPLSELNQGINAKALAKLLSKDKVVYTYCRSGRRSVTAAKLLDEHGYDVRALKAGYAELIENGFKDEKPSN